MKFLIIFAFILATACGLPGKEIKPRNIVVPAGRPEGRITGGNYAYFGQFPYQAGLVLYKPDGSASWCGGSLISHTNVVTAAHCTFGMIKLGVQLGSTDLRYAEAFYEVTPADIIVHPFWDSKTLVNDIALIKIPYTSYSAYIQPVNLPTRSIAYYNFAGENAVASGWGRISDYVADLPKNLQYANFNVVPNNNCRWSFTTPIMTSQLCVSTDNQRSTCGGDSGGPLVLPHSNTLIGITSFGSIHGCQKNVYGVFTRVTSYLDWIEQNSDVSLLN